MNFFKKICDAILKNFLPTSRLSFSVVFKTATRESHFKISGSGGTRSYSNKLDIYF